MNNKLSSNIPVSLISYLESRGPVVLLESQSRDHPEARTDYLAGLPRRIIWGYGDRISLQTESGRVEQLKGDPWKLLGQFYEQSGGWMFGYLGYDLKNASERLRSANPDPVGAPDFFMIEPGLVLEVGEDGATVRSGRLPDLPDEEATELSFSVEGLKPSCSRSAYIEMIRRSQVDITEGSYYEINLSNQMRGSFEGSPFGLYRRMKQEGPVPFGAYLSFALPGRKGSWSVCSASPERFLAKRGDRVFSQPIKGTVGRGETQEQDRRLKEWLEHSVKNRAENLMIVDLVRNDLGRIAQTGSVRVPELFRIHSFETVHQMVSTVEARAGDYPPFEILKACFPMGSMTGAPKISAMRAIEQLETYRRGIYSGAVGYLDPLGNFDFNVVIRTAIIRGDYLYYPVGGAITSDSVPESEWEETVTKAKALTKALPKYS